MRPVIDHGFYEQRAREKSPTSDNPEMAALAFRITDWCELKAGDRVLDFGCFDGWLLRRLDEDVGIEGVGVDISEVALALARGFDERSKLTFLHSDGTRLPFEPESFDVIVCSEILEHVPDLGPVMAELVRVLRRGGTFYATMPNALDDVFPPLRSTCRVVDRVEGHVRRLSREEFLALLERSGLRPLRLRYRGFLLSAAWYRLLVYSPRVNRGAIGLVTSPNRLISTVARRGAFAAMRIYLGFDDLFSSYRGCMGIEAVTTKL